MKVQLHVFLTSTTDSGEQSPSTPALLPGKAPPVYSLNRRAKGESQGRSERITEQRSVLPLPEFESSFVARPDSSPVTIATELPRLVLCGLDCHEV